MTPSWIPPATRSTSKSVSISTSKAYEILRKDLPGIGLFQVYSIYGASKSLKWKPTANEAMFVMDMSWQN